MRRQLQIFKQQFGALVTPLPERKTEKITFHFDFEKGEYRCQNS